MCTGAVVGKGRGAPAHARASRNQLSTEKHIRFGRLFFVFLPDGAQCLDFTMNYHLRDDTVLNIFVSNWPTQLLAPGPLIGDPGRSQESPGRVWRRSERVPGGPIYRKTPDQPPQRSLCYLYGFRLHAAHSPFQSLYIWLLSPLSPDEFARVEQLTAADRLSC